MCSVDHHIAIGSSKFAPLVRKMCSAAGDRSSATQLLQALHGMVKMEKDEVETYIGLEDDTNEGCTKAVNVKAPMDEDNKMTENTVRGELVVSEGDANFEPYEGMEFESEEAARIFYNAYARRAGFRIRISKYSRSRRDNSVISRRVVCSKEGFREVRAKKGLFGERRQRQRAVTRVGCKAMIMVKKLNVGRWIVSKFVKAHNHGPVPPRNVEVRIVRGDDDIVEKTIVSEGDSSIQEPFEGMEFDSEEAANSFYNTYARRMGFRSRISKYCRSRCDNSIISRRIVCSKEGFREIRVKKGVCDEGKIKRPRVITRIGCKAMIIVKKLNSGKWVVSRFEKEHNHALISSKKMLCLQTQSGFEKSSNSNLHGPREIISGLITDGRSARPQSSRESLTILYNQLCHEAIRYAQEGAATEDSYHVAMTALKEAVQKVAAAKRNVVTVAQQSNPVSVTSQGVAINQIGGANLHDPSCFNESKQAIPAQELVLLQQPVNFVLIPSGFASDPGCQNHLSRTPMIINITNGQVICTPSEGAHDTHSTPGMHIISPVSVQSQLLPIAPSVKGSIGNGSAVSDSPSGRKRKLQAINGNKESSGTIQKSQKLDFGGVGQANLTRSCGSNLTNPGFSETQLVAIPALPVALYMPVVGSLLAASSASTPGNSYAFLATPIEASPISACPPEASTQSPLASSPSVPFVKGKLNPDASLINPPTPSKPYTGPNPQVHAAAIAAGARIVPPPAAASLIKAVESRIKAGGGSLGKSTLVAGAKPLAVKPPAFRTCNAQMAAASPNNAGSAASTQMRGDSEPPAMSGEAMKSHSSAAGDNHSVVRRAGEGQSLVDRQVGLLDSSAADARGCNHVCEDCGNPTDPRRADQLAQPSFHL